MSAFDETLSTLHNELATSLLQRLRSGECTAAELNVIRQFLKDNGIDSTPQASKPLQALIGALPSRFPGDELNG